MPALTRAKGILESFDREKITDKDLDPLLVDQFCDVLQLLRMRLGTERSVRDAGTGSLGLIGLL